MAKKQVDDSDNELADTIGQRIKQRRKELDISAADLSKDSGIARSSISHYELGRYLPRAGEIQKICKALDITPSFLIEGTDDLERTKSVAATFLETDSEEQLVMRAVFLFMMLQERDRNALLSLAVSLIEGRVGRDKMLELESFVDSLCDVMGPLIGNMQDEVEQLDFSKLEHDLRQKGIDFEE